MKILVYGAGVIGSLYAGKLQAGGHSVTVLARGDRLSEIRHYGLVLQDVISGGRMAIKVETAERIAADAQYDIALVTVRRDQLASAVPELKADWSIPNFLFMLNNPTGTESLAERLGRDRVLLGFPRCWRNARSTCHSLRFDTATADDAGRNGWSTELSSSRDRNGAKDIGLPDEDIARYGRVA